MEEIWETNKDAKNRKKKHNLEQKTQTLNTTLGMEIHTV